MSKVKNLKQAKPRKTTSPRRRRLRNTQLDVAAMIDKFLLSPVTVREGDTTRRVTCFEAILHQLWRQAVSGSRRADKLLMRYLRFAGSRGNPGGIEFRFGPDLLTEEEVLRKHGRLP